METWVTVVEEPVGLPKSECLADNYRLEVVTTPEDDEVVGWTVLAD